MNSKWGMFQIHSLHKPYGQETEWVVKRIIIYNTGVLSQVDFYVIQVLRYEMGNCNEHILVQCYYYEVKLGMNLLRYQFLYALLITMQDLLLILCWHLEHLENQFNWIAIFLDCRVQKYHFPLMSQNALRKNPRNNYKYKFSQHRTSQGNPMQQE